MISDTKDALILKLAYMLVEKKVDTSVIQDALALICQGFSFDGGAIYETDPYNHFWLTEKYLIEEGCLRGDFSWNEMGRDISEKISDALVSHVEKTISNEPWQTGVLRLFQGDYIVISASVNEQKYPHGLIIFKNTTHVGELSAEHKEALTALILMLGRYVGIRMRQNKLAFAQTSYERILDHTGIDIYVNDFYTHDILYVNESMALPYGGRSQFTERKCWQVLFPGQSGPCEFCPEQYLIDESGDPTKIYTWDYQRKFDGSWFRVFSAAFRWVDGRLAHVVSSADITDNKQKEEMIQYLANYDSLTDLPNRRRLVEDCNREIRDAKEHENRYVLFFDIDKFKQINDNLGHDAGDEFLVQLGKFFSNIPMLHESIYRNGGDEFVAILGGENVTKDHIHNLASFIHQRFKKPWILKAGEVYSGTSIGVACYPEDGNSAEVLLGKADHAMYCVKKNGGGETCFFCELKEQQGEKEND